MLVDRLAIPESSGASQRMCHGTLPGRTRATRPGPGSGGNLRCGAAPAAGAGILVCFSAEREPVLIAALALLPVVITATFLARGRPLAFSSGGRHPRWWPASPPAVARGGLSSA